MKNDIIVIGTNPPCPRCQLMTNVVKAKVKKFKIDAKVKHLSYTDEEAKEICRGFGKSVGTAKDVAKRLGEKINLQNLKSVLENQQSEENCEYNEFNNCNWSYDLDEFLRLFEKRAGEVEMLMTPILIINNELKHQGSLPRIAKFEEWLKEL